MGWYAVPLGDGLPGRADPLGEGSRPASFEHELLGLLFVHVLIRITVRVVLQRRVASTIIFPQLATLC